MKIIGIIPARGGSKGIPRKNIRHLCNLPLLAYSIQAAQNSNLTKYLVSTDDDEIASIATSLGASIVRRPKELSLDNTPTLPVIQHALSTFSEQFDAIMILQPTSPLRTAKHINEAIELFQRHPTADSLVSIVRVQHNFSPASLMKKKGEWLSDYSHEPAVNLLRRQEKPEFWARNGAAIYITKSKNIDKFIIGGNILAYEMNKLESIDIDDEEDWILAELLMGLRISTISTNNE